LGSNLTTIAKFVPTEEFEQGMKIHNMLPYTKEGDIKLKPCVSKRRH